MAKARAILKRLKAIKNIRKITRTMELIATARFKKAMDRATEAAAYTKKIAELASNLSAAAGTSFSHPLLEVHEQPKNGVLLILTSNRGLCGGYNSGVLKAGQIRLRERQAEGQSVQVEVSGKRGVNFCKYQRIPIEQSYLQFEDKPAFADVDPIAERYLQSYINGKIDWLDVAYVRFLSASRQVATVETLLPLSKVEGSSAGESEKKTGAGSDEGISYDFYPSAGEILQEILPAAFKARLFKCFLDAAVSEQIFRMVAMKGATENAADMISTLSRNYNRARQAQITSELSEIIGGAEAIK